VKSFHCCFTRRCGFPLPQCPFFQTTGTRSQGLFFSFHLFRFLQAVVRAGFLSVHPKGHLGDAPPFVSQLLPFWGFPRARWRGKGGYSFLLERLRGALESVSVPYFAHPFFEGRGLYHRRAREMYLFFFLFPPVFRSTSRYLYAESFFPLQDCGLKTPCRRLYCSTITLFAKSLVDSVCVGPTPPPLISMVGRHFGT